MSWLNQSKVKLASVIAGLGVICFWLMTRDPVSQSKWDGIAPGMTKNQVISILGQPTSQSSRQIQYARLLNIGWVEFTFDEKDVLLWKNDESVFVSLE